MCLSKKILYQYFVGFFFPACDSFSAILWVARFELKFLFSNLWKLQKP